jgi:hypothetical protein
MVLACAASTPDQALRQRLEERIAACRRRDRAWRWRRPDCVAAAGGFEPPHPESCPIGPTAIVRHEEWQQIVSQTPSRRVHDLSSPQGTTAVKPAGHKFLMQRFESCRPSRPVRLQRVLKRTALEMPRYRDNAGMVREDGVGNSRSISRLPTAAYFWAAATDRHDLCVAERLFGRTRCLDSIECRFMQPLLDVVPCGHVILGQKAIHCRRAGHRTSRPRSMRLRFHRAAERCLRSWFHAVFR